MGELQLAIMRVLWQCGEATVAVVHEQLPKASRRALTTIATMLKKLELKGAVDHRTEGRVFVYRPLVSEAAVQRSMVSQLTQRLFDGDPARLVSHLLNESELDPRELSELAERIAREEASQEGQQ